MPTACPCCSGRSYAQCCEPYHTGSREAPDAPSLMRSRYSAFALAQCEYLWRTLDAAHPDRARPRERALAELRTTCRTLRYPGLAVLDSAEPDTSGVARVLFLARVFERGTERSFLEASEFLHDGEGWRYLAGTMLPLTKLPRGTDPLALRLATFPPRA